MEEERMYLLLLDLAPLLHSASSAAAFLAFSTAAFWAATSAFWKKGGLFHLADCSLDIAKKGKATFAIPAAFFVFSPAGFFGMLRLLSRDCKYRV